MAQKPKIRTFLNYDHTKVKGTTFDEKNFPSRTVPDQSLSIIQLLDKHRRGLPLPDGKFAVYNGEDYFPDIRRLDLTEVQALAEEIGEKVKAFKDVQRKTKQQRLDEEFNRRVDEEIRRRAEQSADPV